MLVTRQDDWALQIEHAALLIASTICLKERSIQTRVPTESLAETAQLDSANKVADSDKADLRILEQALANRLVQRSQIHRVAHSEGAEALALDLQ